MTYKKFLFAQLVKNKLTYVPLVLLLLACLGTLFLNHQASQANNLGAQIRQNQLTNAQAIEENKARLESLDPESEEYVYISKSIEDGQAIIASDEEFLKAFTAGRWDQVYDFQLDYLSSAKASLEAHSPEKDVLEALDREIAYYTALSEIDLPFEDTHFPHTAFQFLPSLFTYIFPALLPVGIAFVLTNVYGGAYADKLDKYRMLPLSRGQRLVQELGVGFGFSFLLFGLVSLVSFLAAGLAFGFGSLQYPTLSYSLDHFQLSFVTIGSVLLPSLLLQILSLVFVSSLVYLISLVTKNRMTALFLSTVSLFAMVWLPSLLNPLFKIAHLLPTTYMRSFEITTGVFQKGIENHVLSWGLGVPVILVWTALVIGLSYVFLGRVSKM
ncbi:TPA: ABC transporter permease [Streptococcus suis]